MSHQLLIKDCSLVTFFNDGYNAIKILERLHHLFFDLKNTVLIMALDKTQILIDSTRKDLDSLMGTTNQMSGKIMVLTDNLNNIIGDKEFKDTLISTTKSIDRLSRNLNTILEDPKTRQTIDDLQVASKNISEIAQYVNTMTKDPVLKSQVTTTVTKFNKALDDLSCTLETVNGLTTDKKEELNNTINNVAETSKNLRKFSEKLNKRFLLFRLMF